MRDVLEDLLQETRAGRRAVLATIVRSSGSTPRTVGAKMLVRRDGTTVGTIGGGAFEALVGQDALDLLGRLDAQPFVKRYTFTDQGEDALGMACGGTAEVLLDPTGPGERLVIFGAGHVGLALAKLASGVGFEPEIVDDRAQACEAAREMGVGRVYHCDAGYEQSVPAVDPSCYVAVVTRCHETDHAVLRRVIHHPARFLGLIGSRRKKTILFQRLREEDGASEAELEAVHCPIGVPLCGDSPEEIAVSIIAQLLQERHRPRD